MLFLVLMMICRKRDGLKRELNNSPMFVLTTLETMMRIAAPSHAKVAFILTELFLLEFENEIQLIGILCMVTILTTKRYTPLSREHMVMSAYDPLSILQWTPKMYIMTKSNFSLDVTFPRILTESMTPYAVTQTSTHTLGSVVHGMTGSWSIGRQHWVAATIMHQSYFFGLDSLTRFLVRVN